MNVSYEATEIIVSFIEMFLLFRIYGIILRKHKRRESTKQGIILAIIGTAIMHIEGVKILVSMESKSF